MELVKPEVPNAQANKGPELFLEALRGGLAFMSQVAQQRRQSESDVARMAFAERQAADAHELDKRKLDMAAEMLPYQQKLINAQRDFQDARAKAYQDGTATAFLRNQKRQAQLDSFHEDFQVRADSRNLDPAFAAKNPVQFAENFLDQQEEFRMAKWSPQINKALKEYRVIADQQTVKYGTDSEKPTRPVWQIVENLRSSDPAIRAQTIEGLKAGGHFKQVKKGTEHTKSWSRPWDSMWDAIVKPDEVLEGDEKMKQVIERASKFEPLPSRVPSTLLPRNESAIDYGPEDSSAPSNDASAIPASSATPTFEPTETDRLLQNAQAAIQRGAPMKAVAQRLQAMGIDPNQLWAT